MRITFVVPNDGMTGGIRVVSIYAHRLMQRGHTVNVVCCGQRRLRILSKLKSLAAGRGWPKAPEPEPSYFDALSIKIRKLEIARPIVDADVPDADVIIATWWETAEWVNALCLNKGAKVYFIQHHEVFAHLPAERSRATYRLPLQKIVISRWLVNIMKEEYGDPNVILVPNSVDTGQFFSPVRRKQAVPTAGFVYSKVPFKGADVILKALDRAKTQLPALWVLAFGAERTEASESFPEWIEYHYRPPQHEIRQLYSKSDVWLCGSQAEGFYLPMLEAMACRCPVVSTKVGGPIDNIEDGVNGFLVDINDSDSLAEQALRVLRLSEPEWRRMSLAALSTATSYSWDDATDRLERALQQLVR